MRSGFGLYLKELREKRGLSQGKLARLLRLKTAQSVSNIERGISPMPASHVKRVAKILKTPPFTFARQAANAERYEYLKRAGVSK